MYTIFASDSLASSDTNRKATNCPSPADPRSSVVSSCAVESFIEMNIETSIAAAEANVSGFRLYGISERGSASRTAAEGAGAGDASNGSENPIE